MTVSDEDKENSHQGWQEIDPSPATAEARQPELNGASIAGSQPLNDITPAADPEHSKAEAKQIQPCETGQSESQARNGTTSAMDTEKPTIEADSDALKVSGA